MYQYTESGLRNVYLKNGFEEIETPYGVAVHVDNIDGLHQVIADSLIKQPFLSGREFRFLRTQLDLSQREIGEAFGVQAKTVALWEKRGRVPRWADHFIRAYYQNLPTRQVINNIGRAEAARFDPVFQISQDTWRGIAAA